MVSTIDIINRLIIGTAITVDLYNINIDFLDIFCTNVVY